MVQKTKETTGQQTPFVGLAQIAGGRTALTGTLNKGQERAAKAKEKEEKAKARALDEGPVAKAPQCRRWQSHWFCRGVQVEGCWGAKAWKKGTPKQAGLLRTVCKRTEKMPGPPGIVNRTVTQLECTDDQDLQTQVPVPRAVDTSQGVGKGPSVAVCAQKGAEKNALCVFSASEARTVQKGQPHVVQSAQSGVNSNVQGKDQKGVSNVQGKDHKGRRKTGTCPARRVQVREWSSVEVGVCATRSFKSAAKDQSDLQLVIPIEVQFDNGEVRTVQALVDTGAQANLMSQGLVPSCCSRWSRTPLRLVAANGQEIGGGQKETKVSMHFQMVGQSGNLERKVLVEGVFHLADIAVDATLSYPWLREKKLEVFHIARRWRIHIPSKRC